MQHSFSSERNGAFLRSFSYISCILAASILLSNVAPAQEQPLSPQGGLQSENFEQRLNRVERLLSSKILIDLLEQIEQLQTQIRNLRGQVEEQSHRITQLIEQRKKLYTDLHQRINALESNNAQAERTPTPPPKPVTTTSDLAFAEQRAYQKALNFLRQGQYGDAEEAFKAFLENYPAGNFANNAQYWLGETYYVARKFSLSLDAFHKVIRQYPESAKVPGSKLKIGFIHYELGQKDEAKKALLDLLKEDPAPAIARLAQERLQQLN